MIITESYTYILTRGYDEIVVEDPFMALKEIFDEVKQFINNDSNTFTDTQIEEFLLKHFNNEDKSSY